MEGEQVPMSLKYPIDPSRPKMVYGRDLAREALAAALYGAEGLGYAPNMAEVSARMLLERDNETLLGFIGETFAWAQVAVQVATMLQKAKTIEDVVSDIIYAVDTAQQGTGK